MAIKAGVAASLSLYSGVSFSILFDRPDYLLSGTWCVMSTFVVLQAHLGGTYYAAWVRFLGVLLGSFMGGLFTSIFGSNAITLGISVIITVLICTALKLKESIRIACLSVSIVMILWGLHPSMSPWLFGLYRFLDSTLGILIAVIVSHTLWPAKASTKLRESIANILHLINRLVTLELSLSAPPKNYERLLKNLVGQTYTSIEETRQYLHETELEQLTKSRSIAEWETLLDLIEDVFESTRELSSYQEYKIEKVLDKNLMTNLTETAKSCVKTLKQLIPEIKHFEKRETPSDLPEALEKLNEELTRFRSTRKTREFDREDVEHFFVFFYHLKALSEGLLKIEEKIALLNQY